MKRIYIHALTGEVLTEELEKHKEYITRYTMQWRRGEGQWANVIYFII